MEGLGSEVECKIELIFFLLWVVGAPEFRVCGSGIECRCSESACEVIERNITFGDAACVGVQRFEETTTSVVGEE